MAVYLFLNTQPNPQAPTRFVVAFPGSMQQVQAYVNREQYGGVNQHYKVYQISEQTPPTLLAMETYRGPQMSNAYVSNNQLSGIPVGQNQDRPAGEVDRTGFQSLPDSAMQIGMDPMFGDMRDPTFNDLIIDPAVGATEVKR